LTDFFLDLINTHLIGQIVIFFSPKSTEFAEIGADIGIIDVLVVNEVGIVAIYPLPDQIGKPAHSEDIGTLV
jgi:hypothetical protein